MENGAQVDRLFNRNGFSSLMSATYDGYAEVVDVNLQDKDGWLISLLLSTYLSEHHFLIFRHSHLHLHSSMLITHHSATKLTAAPFSFNFVQLQLLMAKSIVAPLLNKSSSCPSLVAFVNSDHPESPCASTSSNNRVSDQLSDGSITGHFFWHLVPTI